MTKILKTSFEKNQGLLCPECKNTIISDTFTGDLICESCGLVTSEKALDISHIEKNIFSYEDTRDRSRTESVDLLFAPKFYFNTVIKKHEITNKDFHRISRLETYVNESDVKNLIIAIRFLKLISGKLRLSYHVKANAILNYRKALKRGIIRGRSIHGMICACLYFACRKFKVPISFNEIVNESNVKEKLIKKCFRVLIKELNLKVLPLGPEIFVSKYINNLKLSSDIERKVLEVLSHLKGFMGGRNPKVICAGLLYLICKKNKIKHTQKEIAEIIGVNEVSLRYTWKQIESYLLKINIHHPLNLLL